MLHKKIKIKTVQPRSQMQLHCVRINNFLFKKTKYTQKPFFNDQASQTNNKTLHLRLKSDAMQKKVGSQSLNLTSPINSQIRQQKIINNRLTNRILKLQHMKHKFTNYNQNYPDQQRFKRKSQNLERPQSFLRTRTSNMKTENNQLDFRVNRSKSFRNASQTKKMFENYKTTRRIVFFQQLQQKKDRQKILFSTNRLRQQHSKNIDKKQKSQKKFSQQINKAIIPYRPWSGHSLQANIQIPVQNIQKVYKFQVDQDIQDMQGIQDITN